MRSINKKELLTQARDFHKETKYIPSNYDALFHTHHFSSPVTIRRHFGGWDTYMFEAFSSMVLGYNNKMFYGGFNRKFTVTLPHFIEAIKLTNSDHNVLGDLSYDNLSPSEAWITTKRWEDILEILIEMGVKIQMVSAEKRFLTPYAIINDTFVVASFDTPHMKGHYKRTTKVMEYLNKNYDLININGVKKNHIKNAIKRMLVL